jgi:hypothetical protein
MQVPTLLEELPKKPSPPSQHLVLSQLPPMLLLALTPASMTMMEHLLTLAARWK